MNSEQMIAMAMRARIAKGLGLIVHGLPDRPAHIGPFTCYAKDEAQKAAWIADANRKGATVEIMSL